MLVWVEPTLRRSQGGKHTTMATACWHQSTLEVVFACARTSASSDSVLSLCILHFERVVQGEALDSGCEPNHQQEQALEVGHPQRGVLAFSETIAMLNVCVCQRQ